MTETQRESEWYENLAIKIFSEFCCESCSCKGEQDHVRESAGTNN